MTKNIKMPPWCTGGYSGVNADTSQRGHRRIISISTLVVSKNILS
jgi:hypothetical protein